MSITNYEAMSRAVDQNAHLTSPTEFMILRFVFGRTYGCGKEWAEIKPSHFAEGIHEDDGTVITPALRMSSRTAHTHIAVLERYGMLKVDRRSKPFRYSLNLCWFMPEELKASQPDLYAL